MAFHTDLNNIVTPVGSCSFSTVFLFEVRDDSTFVSSANTADIAVIYFVFFSEVFMVMKLLLISNGIIGWQVRANCYSSHLTEQIMIFM